MADSIKLGRVLLLVLLAVFLGRIVLTYPVFNNTTDEPAHIAAGLEYLQDGKYELEPQHPPLGRLVVALLPYYLGGLRLDGPHRSLWSGGAWEQRDSSYYWFTLTLARVGNLIFALLVFLVVYRWSFLLHGRWAALAGCALVACSPNLIAHSSLATLDIGATAGTLAAAFFFWRWSEHPGWRYCLGSAVAFGLAVLCKFSALVFLPPMALAYLVTARWRLWRSGGGCDRASLEAGLKRAAVFVTVAGVTIWAGYSFEVGRLVPAGHRPTAYYHSLAFGTERNTAPWFLARAVADHVVPAPRFWQGLIDVFSHDQSGHLTYLLGRRSQHGWWYYFPVAVGVKTTLPLLVLVGMSVVWAASGRWGRTSTGILYPLWAVAAVMGTSMAANLNIGIRHVLPLYPFFAILASGLFREPARIRVLALILLVWHAAESALAHPDYLPYFNQIARGKEEKFLLDSNLDWGQDLARLGRYMQQHQIPEVQLGYSGVTVPFKVGVPHVSACCRPHAGWVAISVNRFFGIPDGVELAYEWRQDRKPVARVGKSIWLYYDPLPPGHRNPEADPHHRHE